MFYKRIACARNCTLCIDDNDNVWSFGFNNNGICGHDNIDSLIFPPKQIPFLFDIKMVYCGIYHSACLDYDGNIFTFGSNNYGQLGLGDSMKENTNIPTKVNLPPVFQLSCGAYHTICLLENSEIYSFGKNTCGQLGNGDCINSYNPVKVLIHSNIQYITAGGNHSICITDNNISYFWGYSSYGQIIGDNNSNIPKECINWPKDIISISCGYQHTCILTSCGKVFVCGNNEKGQLGIGSKFKKSNELILLQYLPEIIHISTAFFNSYFIDINKNLWVTGWNKHGQLGIKIKENKQQINKPRKHTKITNILDISTGTNHLLIKTINNKIYSCGCNDSKQIGQTKEKTQKTLKQVLKGKENIWTIKHINNRIKSARK